MDTTISHAAEKAFEKAEEQIDFWLEGKPVEEQAAALLATAEALKAEARYRTTSGRVLYTPTPPTC
ncbi:hypothetical protein [Hymenobacter tenuis]